MVVVPDWAIYAGYTGLLGFILGWIIARLRTTTIKQPQGEDKDMERREHAKIDNVIGLDKALAAKFYRSLRKSLASGEVNIGLISEKCPDGYVAYDFVREDWICVEKNGSSHRLGGEPVEDLVEIEELDEEGVGEDGG